MLSLVLAYVLLLQSVFIAFAATEHALAADNQLAVICAFHQDSGAPAKAPVPLHHYNHCPICFTAASSAGVLPDEIAVLEDLSGGGNVSSPAHLAADLPQPPSPKRAQGPPLTA